MHDKRRYDEEWHPIYRRSRGGGSGLVSERTPRYYTRYLDNNKSKDFIWFRFIDMQFTVELLKISYTSNNDKFSSLYQCITVY